MSSTHAPVNSSSLPQGVGIGLRRAHYPEWLAATTSEVDWLEIVPENFEGRGGMADHVLGRVRERWPVIAHGVSLDLGGTSAWPPERIRSLRRLLDRIGAPIFTEHLCWSIAGERSTYDLVPLPFRRDAARHTAQRVRQLADALERPIALENITYYAHMPGSLLDEGEFVREVLERADAALLLDVNNAYCNAMNHGLDPWESLLRLPLERVAQIHIAGHVMDGSRWFDNHGAPIADVVLDLYGKIIEHLGDVPTLLEWDTRVPPLERVLAERRRVVATRDAALERRGRAIGAAGTAAGAMSGDLAWAEPRVAGTTSKPEAALRAADGDEGPSGMSSFFRAAQDWVEGNDAPDNPEIGFSVGDIRFYATLFRRNFDKILRDLYADVERACRRLGAASWSELVDAHVQRTPCVAPDPNQFGDGFDATIQERCPEHTWLAELADFAWTRHRAWTAPDSEGPGLDERVMVRHYTRAIHELSRALADESRPVDDAIVQPRPTTLVIFRHAQTLNVRVHPAGAAEILALMRRAMIAPSPLPLAERIVDEAEQGLIAIGCLANAHSFAASAWPST